MTPATACPPGDGPLLGAGSPFAAARLAEQILALEGRRFAWLRGAALPPAMDDLVRWVAGVLGAVERQRFIDIVTGPEWRRWITRMVYVARDPAQHATGMGTAVSVRNLLAVPWLECGGEGTLELAVYGGGIVPFPGSGIQVPAPGSRARVRLVADSRTVRLLDDDGQEIVNAARPAFLEAFSTGTPLAGVTVDRRIPGTEITVGLDDDVALSARDVDTWLETIGAAVARLDARWPAAGDLVRTLARRLHLDGHDQMYSKCTSELPGVVFLGRKRLDLLGIAELLVHECMHLAMYELERQAPLLGEPDRIRCSPFSRVERPARLVLHGTAAFLVQSIVTHRLADPPAGELRSSVERVRRGVQIIEDHLAEIGESPTPFVQAVRAELALLESRLDRPGPQNP